MISFLLLLLLLLFLVVFLTLPLVVDGRCEGVPETCGGVPPSSCHGFSPQFCIGMRNICDGKCQAEGCSCEWTQVGFSCQTGPSSCRWKGKCVPDGAVVPCSSLATQDLCVTQGCQWVNNTNATATNGTSSNIVDDGPTQPPPPLKLNNLCFDQIESIGTCLAASSTSGCLDCTLGKKGIVVPEGGFRTCAQVQQEYCKAGSQTLGSGGFLTDCCGSCQVEVVEYLQCLYGCPDLTCDDDSVSTSPKNPTTTTEEETTTTNETNAASPTTTTTAAARDNPNLRRH